MNEVRNYLFVLHSGNIVKPLKVDLFHDICPELHEGLDITDITINPGEAEDDSNTKDYEMSDEHSLTDAESHQ